MTVFKNKNKAIFYSFIVSLLFVLHFYVAKDVLRHVHPLSLGGFRGLIGGFLIIFVYKNKINFKAQRPYLLGFIAIAFLGFFINQYLFLNGLKLTAPLNASIILNTIPLGTALMAMIFKIEKFTSRKFFGVCLGFLMVSFLAFNKFGDGANQSGLGDLLIFASVICLCAATNISKVIIKKGAFPALVSGLMLFLGGLGLCILGYQHFSGLIAYSTTGSVEAFKIFYEVVFSTALTYFLSMEALKYLHPSQSMIFIYAQPLMTTSIDFFFFEKVPSIYILPVFLGICVAGWLVISNKKICFEKKKD